MRSRAGSDTINSCHLYKKKIFPTVFIFEVFKTQGSPLLAPFRQDSESLATPLRAEECPSTSQASVFSRIPWASGLSVHRSQAFPGAVGVSS